jgi:hypothetical protein
MQKNSCSEKEGDEGRGVSPIGKRLKKPSTETKTALTQNSCANDTHK